MDEEGLIPEEHFNLCGVWTDKNINGNVVIMLMNISQESYQRSNLTHPHQVDLRLEPLLATKPKEIKKKTTANMKHNELVNANKKVVKLICKKLLWDGIIGKDTGVGEYHMKLCSMKIVSELTNPQLESFILANNATITSKSQLPSMGSLKDAKDNTVWNRIQVAFDCRESPNKIEGVLPFDVSTNLDNDKKENYWVALPHGSG